MKVLVVTGLTSYALGGVRAELLRLVRGLKGRGVDVALAADAVPEPIAGTTHYPLDFYEAHKNPAELSEAVRHFRPDVVHVLGGGIRTVHVAEDCLASVPWTFTAHNVPPAERLFTRLFATPRLYYAARNLVSLPSALLWRLYLCRGSFQRVICHSGTVADRVRARGCDPTKVSLIPFGSSPPLASDKPSPFPDGASPRIVTVAGLAPHKGHMDFLRVIARLKTDFPKLSYRMIGMARGELAYAKFVREYIRRNGLDGHVEILASAPESVKWAALRDADLYVQPSHEEGFCIAFLEAAMAVPKVIGGATGEMPGIVAAAGDAGAAVVPPMNVSALEAATRKLIATELPAGVLGARRERLATHYNWEAYLDQHLATYQETIALASPVEAAVTTATAKPAVAAPVATA